MQWMLKYNNISCPVYKEDIAKALKFMLDNKEQGRKSNELNKKLTLVDIHCNFIWLLIQTADYI